MQEQAKRTIYQVFKDSAKMRHEKPALIFLGKKFSYKTAEKNIDALKNALLNKGLQKGEIVLTCLPNIPQAAYLLYAVAGAGGVAFPVHALAGAEQIDALIKQTNARFLFALSAFADAYEQTCKQNGALLIAVSPAAELGLIKKTAYKLTQKRAKKALSLKSFIAQSTHKKSTIQASAREANDPHDTAILLNSGGTAGMPKIVEISHFALNTLCQNTLNILCETSVEGKYMMSALPFFHGFGLAMGLHAMVYFGGCNVLIPKFRRKYAMKYVLKKQIHFMIGVPALYGAIMSHKKFKGKILQSIRQAFVGGDFVPQTLIDEFNDRMLSGGSKARMHEGYGLTETISVSCVNIDTCNRQFSVGKALNGIEVKAFDTQCPSEPLEHGQTGEIYISGKTLMNRYYKDDKATHETFFVDKSGAKWLKTGDYGYVDKDGFVYFKQRLKRIIKVSGVSVFPAEIEQSAMKIDGVSNACAFGVPDKKRGNAVVLAVKTSSKDDMNLEKSIRERLEKELSVDALPKDIIFLESFPMTKINKVDFEELKKQYCAKTQA